jgi:two-component system chemotaxis sensor kinase CheA
VDDIVKEFLIESNENLDRLDINLVELEKSPRDQELLADIFRTIHSIKGTTGFLGFHHLESVAHAGENLLSRLRDGLLVLNPEITTGLLSMVDAIREMLRLIEGTEADGSNDYPELIAQLALLQTPSASSDVKQEEAKPEAESVETQQDGVPASGAPLPEAAPSQVTPIANAKQEGYTPLGELLSKQGIITEAELSAALDKQQHGDPRKLGEILIEESNAKAADVLSALSQQQQMRDQTASERSIRVDVSLLERLMDLVGELVLTRNQIIQFAATQRDGSFLAVSQKLNLVTSDMREIIMKTRMQPIQNVMGKFPRIVRDLALSCGKRVRIETTGQETELDRTILEAIKDPLTHAVRNSVDHGIERPDVRIAAGKDAEGVLSLRAYHEGGQVNIEIGDDGAGIDPARIRAKALEKGLITPQQAERMSTQEVISLIFAPGFSTAEKITNVSGRGVGMDVVRTNIERIGGTVDVQSVLGHGSTVRMKIPLTLAIIPALIVSSTKQRFAIPQVSLLELLRLEGGRSDQAVEMVHGAPVYRLRGNLLPLLFLDRELKQRQENKSLTEQLNIVVLQAENQQFGLVVDGIHDAEEIVVKPLGQHLKHITAFSGATVMGDGAVALILDVVGLAKRGRLLTEAKKAALQEDPSSRKTETDQVDEKTRELLLFRTAGSRRAAVDLSSVDRLEEFKLEQFERAGHQTVVQYRGELLPIVDLSDKLSAAQSGDTGDLMKVLVCHHDGLRMGVVVDQILDVANESFEVEQRFKDSQSEGSAVIHKQVTDLLDLGTIFGSAQASLCSQEIETVEAVQ